MLDEKIDIQCIGHLESWDILERSWLKPIDFYDKTIVDFWCWVSDLLFTILEEGWDPKSLYWVDPIFESPESLQQAQKSLSIYLNKLADDYERLSEVVVKIQRKLDILSRFPHNDSIKYISNASVLEQGSVDYLFINFLLYRVDNKSWFVNELLKYLNSSGKIIVTDHSYMRKDLHIPNFEILYEDHETSSLEIMRI